MAGETDRFYGELASWWPLVSPVADYTEEAAFIGELLRAHARPVRDVLELGCGGGHNAAHLKAGFDLVLTDRSSEMLAQSAALNPECRHVQGDMRALRLGRRFDAVLLHDAVEYLVGDDDLRAAFTTAHDHLEPGGLLVVMPDATAETFAPSEEVGGSDGDGRAVRLLEWTYDPDPSDGWVQTDYVFVLHEDGAETRVVHETHRTGLRSRAEWETALADSGFAEVTRIVERTDEDREGRDVFLAVRA